MASVRIFTGDDRDARDSLAVLRMAESAEGKRNSSAGDEKHRHPDDCAHSDSGFPHCSAS
jgi:hypothetical protein